jgi:hypothetical protein
MSETFDTDSRKLLIGEDELLITFHDEGTENGTRYLKWTDKDGLITGHGDRTHLASMLNDEDIFMSEEDHAALENLKPGEVIAITIIDGDGNIATPGT